MSGFVAVNCRADDPVEVVAGRGFQPVRAMRLPALMASSACPKFKWVMVMCSMWCRHPGGAG